MLTSRGWCCHCPPEDILSSSRANDGFHFQETVQQLQICLEPRRMPCWSWVRREVYADGKIVTHRYASYFEMEVGCPTTLYTRDTVGQAVGCRHEALNWSATIRYETSGHRLSYYSIPLWNVSCALGTSTSSGAFFSTFEVHALQKLPLLTAFLHSRQPFFSGLERKAISIALTRSNCGRTDLEGATDAPPATPAAFACCAQVLPQKE